MVSAQAWRAIANQWRESERWLRGQADFAQRCALEADRRAEQVESGERAEQSTVGERGSGS